MGALVATGLRNAPTACRSNVDHTAVVCSLLLEGGDVAMASRGATLATRADCAAVEEEG